MEANQTINIEVKKNGPLRVTAEKMIVDIQGNLVEKETISSFCRCGKSQKQPFCDGAHKEAAPFE